MYQADVRTGETVFTFTPNDAVRTVFLVSQDDNTATRIPMRVEDGRWIARLKVHERLFIYRFEADGRAFRDRDACRVRCGDGLTWSLAVLPGGGVSKSSCRQSKTNTEWVNVAVASVTGADVS